MENEKTQLILAEIDVIVSEIYEGKIEDANELIIEFVSSLQETGMCLDSFTEILELLFIAMENKDYQLVGDILIYELKRIISQEAIQ